jgi:glycine/D-amino acid oxidase-like deaminating enzyme
MSWDGVVVGAGHNGLVAANLLADAGWSVLVLEANAAPGGGTRTAELAAPGFRSELCSAFYPLTAASPVIAALGLDRYGLRWRHHCVPLVHVLPDGRTAAVPRPSRDRRPVERYRASDGERFWPSSPPADQDALIGSLLRPFPPVQSGPAGPPAQASRTAAVRPVRRQSPAATRGAVAARARGCWSPATRYRRPHPGHPPARDRRLAAVDAGPGRRHQWPRRCPVDHRALVRRRRVAARDPLRRRVTTIPEVPRSGSAPPTAGTATRAVLADVSAPALYRDQWAAAAPPGRPATWPTPPGTTPP